MEAKVEIITQSTKYRTKEKDKFVMPNTKLFSSTIIIYQYINNIARESPIFYRYRKTSPTAHRKIDRIEMNIKVSYRLAIFAIIIEILIFEIVLMKARREKRSNRSRYSPAQV